MIRKSPAEYYLKYLVSHPAHYSDKYIQEDFAVKGLDWNGSEYLERVKRQTIPPVPFSPLNSEHVASMRFLHTHRLRSLYYPDGPMQEAWQILNHPKAKEFVESMWLSGALASLIARGLPIATRIDPVSEEGVKRFAHFFWNADLLDFTEMRAVVLRRGVASEDPAYKKAFYKDSRKVAAELPFSPLSAVIAQMRLGITPKNVNFAELMDRVRVAAGLRAYQWVMEDSPAAGEIARNFMSVATDATDLMERSARPEEKLLERFNALGIEQDTGSIPHSNQLSGGKHTVDLQVVETKREVVEVDDEH